MTGSLTSRMLLARLRQPPLTAGLLGDHTATYRATLQRRLFVPRMQPSAPISSPSATNNTIQNA